MAKGYHLNVFVDREIERALRDHAEKAGQPLSAVVRDLLRHALGTVSSHREAGWQEGYTAGLRAVQTRIGEALKGLAPE
jgi:hypothetical protein